MIGLGGNSTLGIGVLIELKDNFTSTSKRVNTEMERMHSRAKAIMGDNLRNIGTAGMTMMAVGGAMTMGFNSAIKAATQFQFTMTKVKALGQLDNPQTKLLGNFAKNLAKKYGIMPNEIAGAILELVKRGVSGNDIPKVLEAQIMTAIGADERLGGEGGVAARMMDMAMAWGYKASQVNKIGDMMAKGTQLTSMGFLDLAESMKYSQDVLKSLNLSFGESVAMIGLLSNAGIKGSMAGTALNNFYTQFTIALTGASKKKNSALAAMGLTPEDFIKANGDMLGLIPTLRKLESSLKPFGGVSRQGLLNDIFGIRGKRAANPLMDALYSDGKLGMGIEELLSQITKSEGTNESIYKQLSETFEMKKKRFAATFENFKINVGSALLPALTGIIKALTPMLSLVASFAESKVGKIFIGVVAAGGLMSLLFGGFLFAISKIGLGFLGWKSTLDQIRMTMGWVMGGGKARMLATIPGQGINSMGSVYDKNGMLINNMAMASMGMNQAAYRQGAGNRSSGSSPGGIFMTPAARQRAAMGMAAKKAATKSSAGLLGRLFSGLASKVMPLISLFGRLLPIIGWIWTAYSIISALWGGGGDDAQYSSSPREMPERYNYRMANSNKYESYIPGRSQYNQSPPTVNVQVNPSEVNLYTDGEKSWSQKMNWQAEQGMADEGFNQ